MSHFRSLNLMPRLNTVADDLRRMVDANTTKQDLNKVERRQRDCTVPELDGKRAGPATALQFIMENGSTSFSVSWLRLSPNSHNSKPKPQRPLPYPQLGKSHIL